MGSGKTSVGERVAAALGRPFVDSDDFIEQRTGRTVREIWLDDGEPAFRALEAKALEEALAGADPTVIAAAGGVVMSEHNRRALGAADATVVWLHADPSVLAERATRGEHRPLLDEDPDATLNQMAADRDPLYREVADAVVDVARPLDDIVADVLGLVRRDG
jgi:shikimate kinase